jgi:hypothetical protein
VEKNNDRTWPMVLAYLAVTLIVTGIVYAIFGDAPRA